MMPSAGLLALLLNLTPLNSMQAKHFLIETKDNSESGTTLKDESDALLSVLPKEIKRKYESVSKAVQKELQKKLLKYSIEHEAMVEDAKDKNLIKVLTGDNGNGFDYRADVKDVNDYKWCKRRGLDGTSLERCFGRRKCRRTHFKNTPYLCDGQHVFEIIVKPDFNNFAKEVEIEGKKLISTINREGKKLINAIKNLCFSGASTVQTRRGVLSMDQLVLGDSVLTVSSGKGLVYTEFLGWLDRSANAYGDFLKISTNSSSIILTGNHLIFRITDGVFESVFADEIEEGDTLVSWKGSKMVEKAVVQVEPAREKGIWAPLTMEGTLLVDGLLASCYASFSHAVSDLALAPVKMFPRMLLDDEESVKVDGCREVVKLTKKVVTAMGLRQRNQGVKKVPKNVCFSGKAAPAGSSKHIEL